MGEAKRRRELRARQGLIVYHHTSTLRTNLIWMSGVIDLEGRSPPVFHPHLGEIRTDALARRSMNDFAPLAWFTTQISVPQCLIKTSLLFVDKTTGATRTINVDADVGNAMALNRLALRFRVSDIPVMPWADHPGYSTSEGIELNETAIEAGDDPRHWYVSEQPVDVLKAIEVWSARSIKNPWLQREDWYLKDVHNMVRNCRIRKDVLIPPTWLSAEDAKLYAAMMGLPAISGAESLSGLPLPMLPRTDNAQGPLRA